MWRLGHVLMTSKLDKVSWRKPMNILHLLFVINMSLLSLIRIPKISIRRISPHGYLGSHAVLIVYQSLQGNQVNLWPAILMESILALGVDRQTVLIALGGGVIGDLVGFAAASLLRGVDFIQIPTSLLAQVDSSVGGKTGINARVGKNLIGAFYQPKLVLADSDVLRTLPEREMRAGYAEIVKYGLLGDASFFEWLEANGADVIQGQPEAIAHAVRTSCLAKAAIVSADETEAGKRALLNLGHTFAHAFEAEAGYDGRLLHGEAVAVGLGLAFEFSAFLDRANGQEAVRVKSHLAKLGLPASIADLPAGHASAQTLVRHMYKDKKTQNGVLTFILVEEIGKAEVVSHIQSEDVERFLESRF